MIRLAIPQTDFGRIAELLSMISTEPVTAASLHEDENRLLAGKIRRRWVTLDSNEQIVGYSMTVKYPSEPTGYFHIELVVDPAHRGQGIGSRLYEETAAFAQEQGAIRLMVEVRENDPISQAFAEKRGYKVEHHVFDSVLDVASFDESRFAGVIEQIEAAGIRFTTFAAEGDTPENRHKLYAINRMAALDEPTSLGTFPVYKNWCKLILESASYRAESQFLALDGDQYIGLAGVYNEPEFPESMYNGYTGVDQNYGGGGIALALKLLTIRYAREHGATTVTTGNDARNEPMLKINHKLGYQPMVGHYGMVKIVD
jgi:RimJ/RimL family protein N-acetyltransferase